MLEDMTVHLPIIEIRIVECRGRAQGYEESQDVDEGRPTVWRKGNGLGVRIKLQDQR